MRPTTLPELAKNYSAALHDYLAGAEETTLAHAYEMGRRAMDSGLGVLDITLILRNALAIALERARDTGEASRVAGAALTFFAESLAAFDMAQQGYRAATTRLQTEIAERKQAEEIAHHAQEEAERANQAKSEFLSRMSHELRTPFNAVLGFAQLLEMDDLDEDQRDCVHQIIKAGRHLLDLINEVLDLSRIESGTLTLSLEPIDVWEVANETLDLVNGLATKGSVELRAEIPEADASYVMADRQRLKQVLLNLLSNAVKYNREGGTATVTCGENAEGLVRIEVTDTGEGISEERIDRLFNAFDRLGAEHSEIEGTGLGLALSKRLVEAMGGTIGLGKTSDAGTTFFLELRSATAPVDGYHISREAASPTAAIDGARSILCIEDNLPNLTLVERVLTHRPQVKLIAALQGSLGLELALEHRPDLVLLDLNLPDLQGEEVLGRLLGDPRTATIPVVVISADATPRQIRRLLAAGARDYLTKPLDVSRFLQVVDRILAPARQGPAPDQDDRGLDPL